MGLTILLAEDDRNIAFMLADSLEDEGFSVFPISNGDELPNVMQSITPDIAVLDIQLEGNKDGFEIAREIRTKYPALPLIFATSRNHYPDIKKGLEFGNAEYIKKPYSIKELLMYINKRLNLPAPHPDSSKKEHLIGSFTFIPEELILLYKNEHIQQALFRMNKKTKNY